MESSTITTLLSFTSDSMRFELHADVEIADELRGLEKTAPDIVVGG